MPHFAAVFVRRPDGWTGREVRMDGLETLDEVADLMRDTAREDEPALLYVEEDDEWFALVRVDGSEDPRAFISDVRAPSTSDLAAVVYEPAAGAEIAAGEEARGLTVAGEPAGDLELLEDLGVDADELVALTVGEGLLPSDVLAAVADVVGFSAAVEKLR